MAFIINNRFDKGGKMRQCAFFDRDGVINHDTGYVYQIKDFVFCDGVFEILNTLHQQQYLLIVLTNQSGIARGYYTESDLAILHNFMQEELTKHLGFAFDAIYHCPHLPTEDCQCRKPKIGMITQALQKFDIDLQHSFFVGDRVSDMECAQNAGIYGKFFLGKEQEEIKNIQNVQKITSLHQLNSIIKENVTRSN